MGIMSYQEFIKETPKPKLSLSDLLMVNGLKDPIKPAKPLKVTQAMVEREGSKRRYPSSYIDANNKHFPFQVSEKITVSDDGEIFIDYINMVSSPEITANYVREFCSMNNLKVAS